MPATFPFSFAGTASFQFFLSLTSHTYSFDPKKNSGLHFNCCLFILFPYNFYCCYSRLISNCLPGYPYIQFHLSVIWWTPKNVVVSYFAEREMESMPVNWNTICLRFRSSAKTKTSICLVTDQSHAIVKPNWYRILYSYQILLFPSSLVYDTHQFWQYSVGNSLSNWTLCSVR